MTREEAIEELFWIREDENDLKGKEALNMAIKALEAPPNDNWEGYSKRLWKNAYERGKAEAEQRWIPVSERLPKIGERVMVTVQHEFDEETVDITTYSKRGFYIQPVVAWMPLPEPYKAESNLDGDPVDIDKAVEHYEGTLQMLKDIGLGVDE